MQYLSKIPIQKNQPFLWKFSFFSEYSLEDLKEIFQLIFLKFPH